MSEVIRKGQAAKAASYQLSSVTTEEKNVALALIAEQIVKDQDIILKENKKDIDLGKENGLTNAVLDRIYLDKARIEGMAKGIRLLIELEDPIGEVLETIEDRKSVV